MIEFSLYVGFDALNHHVILPLCWQKGLNPFNIGSPGSLTRNLALVYVFDKSQNNLGQALGKRNHTTIADISLKLLSTCLNQFSEL